MLFKYYTANVSTLHGSRPLTPSITIKVWIWSSPIDAVDMMKNQLKKWGFDNHQIFDLRRIK